MYLFIYRLLDSHVGLNVKGLKRGSTPSCDPGDQIVINKITPDWVKSQPLETVVVRRDPRSQTKALVNAGGLIFPALIGRSGRTALKIEGDGATPLASMRVLYGYYRADRVRPPMGRVPLVPIAADMGWCDAPDHGVYNRLVRLPFSASHENLMRDDNLYDICLVLDWNLRQRRRYRGSAIFFHLASPEGKPTQGCIAVSQRAMIRLLQIMGPHTSVRVV